MAGQQVIHDNGRVNIIVQWFLSIAATLITAGIIGLVFLVLDLRDAQKDTNANINMHIQASGYEHTDIDRRIRAIEQQRARNRDDSRDQ